MRPLLPEIPPSGGVSSALSNRGAGLRRGAAWLTLAMGVALLAACGRAEAPPAPVRAVRTTVVAPGQLALQSEYAAEIRARTESRLSFRVGGKLTERPVQLGDTVRKGQVLARLDPADLKLIEESAIAGVQAAQANAAQAEADLKRFRGLYDQGFISAAELERRTTAATSAAAQLAQAKAQADVQGRQTSFGTLLADASGVITGVDAEPGAVIGAGTPIVRLAWDGPRDVVFAVPEDRVAPIRALIGKSGAVSVRLWGETGEPLRATIREVAAATDPVTRTFSVKADLIAASGAVAPRLGQTAVVTLSPAGGSTVALKLPMTAVMQQQGQTAVWLLDAASMTVKLQPITVAAADGNELVVASGLTPGQEVVVAGVHVLNAGQKVRRYQEAVAGTVAPPASAARPSAPAASR